MISEVYSEDLKTLLSISPYRGSCKGGVTEIEISIRVTMKITPKLIQNIVEEVVGADALPIIQFLKDKKNISEFKIAEKLKLEVNITRNILYRLHDKNLAVYIKKKDRQKGWYISYWTFNPKRVKELTVILKRNKIESLKQRLKKEIQNLNNFYMCRNACTRLDFDTATEFEFKCPECGNLLNQQENQKTIETLKQKIDEIEAG